MGVEPAIQETMIGLGQPYEAKSYGHWIKRVTSFVLDELVIAPFVAIGYVLIAQGTPGWLTFGTTIVAFGMAMGFYNRCIRMAVTGQSWGKLATGTRLVSAQTGEPLGVGPTVIREMCHAADFVLIIGGLFPLIDSKRQSWGDKLAGSVVINAERGSGDKPLSLPH